jgi:CRP-like cAMP-binding protein
VHGRQRGDITIQTVSSGEVLGFSWMMEPYQYRFDALVLEPTMTRSFDAAKLRKVIEDELGFGYDLVRRFNLVISQRLQAARLQILDMYGEFSLDDVP